MSNKFKFKSSGINIDTVNEQEQIALETIPFNANIGIKTPLELDKENLFKMHNNVVDQVADNLKNLILTNHGERLVFHDFGANLRELLTEYTTETVVDFQTEVTNRIITAVNKWMPFIELIDLNLEPEENTINGIAVIVLNLVFNVLGIENGSNKKIKVKLFVI